MCLCQRLGHACLRASLTKVKPRMAASDRLGIQVAVDSSSFVIRRFSFWSVQGICIALLRYQLRRVLPGLSKRPSLHSLITLLKRCVSLINSDSRTRLVYLPGVGVNHDQEGGFPGARPVCVRAIPFLDAISHRSL